MEKKTFISYSFVFGLIYFLSINGLASLPNISVSFLLKEVLGLTAAQAAYFGAVTILAWIIKPLWGLISDYLPIFGYRRKSYLIIMSAVAGLSWLVLSFVDSYTVALLLSLIILSYMAYAFQDVVTDGLMVETGQPENLTGRFQSIQWGAVYLASIITALAGGYITDLARAGQISYQSVFGATAVFPLITILAVVFLVKEEKYNDNREKLKDNWKLLKLTFKKKDLWLLALFLFLWNFSPSFGTPFFYYSVDTLKFDASFLGILGSAASAAALFGAIIFGKYLSHIPIRKLLVFSIYLGVFVTLFNLVYFLPYVVSNPATAKIIAFISDIPLAIIGTVIFLTLLNLAAKISPIFAGGTVFAFLMSFFNLGNMGSQALGGYLFSFVGLQPLIIISALFSFLALFLMPYLSIGEELTRSEKTAKRFIDPIVNLLFSLLKLKKL